MTAPSFELAGATVVLGGREVLRSVDLRIDVGEAVALVGPSGAGKTTLLRVLGGSLLPARGTARIGGVDLAALRPRERRAVRARLGFVHQDHSLVPVLRVSQNVLAGRLGRVGFLGGLRAVLAARSAELAEVHRVLERVGVAEKLFQRTDTLSGGQQQRVAIARALYQEPTVLLADEPVASVDPARARDLIALLTQLAAEEGLTLVASLHDLALAREFFPRIVGLRAGEVRVDSPTAAVTEDALARIYQLDGAHTPSVDEGRT